jgi:hypothetical protein
MRSLKGRMTAGSCEYLITAASSPSHLGLRHPHFHLRECICQALQPAISTT